jgi:hypothetical protein
MIDEGNCPLWWIEAMFHQSIVPVRSILSLVDSFTACLSVTADQDCRYSPSEALRISRASLTRVDPAASRNCASVGAPGTVSPRLSEKAIFAVSTKSANQVFHVLDPSCL